MQPEQYFKDGKQHFGLDRSTVTTTDRLQRLLVGLLLACCLLVLAGLRVSPTFRRQVCSRGKLSILHLGYEYYLATLDPPHNLFDTHRRQTGYAWGPATRGNPGRIVLSSPGSATQQRAPPAYGSANASD